MPGIATSSVWLYNCRGDDAQYIFRVGLYIIYNPSLKMDFLEGDVGKFCSFFPPSLSHLPGHETGGVVELIRMRSDIWGGEGG